MIKIKKISFKNHNILGNLTLDFTDANGNAVDTVILAGENGTGKSTILKALYQFAIGTIDFECKVTIDISSEEAQLKFDKDEQGQIVIHDQTGKQLYAIMSSYKNKYTYPVIYSDVDIDFNAKELNSVTSLDIDMDSSSRHSNSDFPTRIKQLLIDIQDQDAQELQTKYYKAKQEGRSTENLDVENKMQRFTQAFNKMFDNITFEGIKNIKGHKAVLFNKDGTSIPIDNLSSGEKQIVYRGCFLLQDINALKGALVLIDEPEISMHPRWQNKIMDFYKSIFTNDHGVQTSQMIVVTHSPFIIHNDNRKNDKVIVLKKDKNGGTVVEDKAEYYKCNSIEAVKDAFLIDCFNPNESMVYLEGPTDEKYFQKAAEVYGYNDLPFKFKWIGYINENNKNENSGKDALRSAVKFLISENLSVKNIVLFDCDVKKEESKNNNVYVRTMPTFDNIKNMNVGIENALILDDVDVMPFYTKIDKAGQYGNVSTICNFEKMDFCDYLCSLDDIKLRMIFQNLKDEIDKLVAIF